MNKYIKGAWKDAIVTDQGVVVEPGKLIMKDDLDRIEDGVESAILNAIPTVKTTGTASALRVVDDRVTGITAINKLWVGYGIKVILHIAPTVTATIKIGGLPATALNIKAKTGDVALVIFDGSKLVVNKVGGGTASETSITDKLAVSIPSAANVEDALAVINTGLIAVKPSIIVTANQGASLTCTSGTTILTATADADGQYIFILPKRGTWVVTDGTTTVNVIVAMQGDYTVDLVGDYEQLVNYTMLYDQGDECAAVTGGIEAGFSTPTGTSIVTKNISEIKIKCIPTSNAGVSTTVNPVKNSFGTEGFNKTYCICKVIDFYKASVGGAIVFGYLSAKNTLMDERDGKTIMYRPTTFGKLVMSAPLDPQLGYIRVGLHLGIADRGEIDVTSMFAVKPDDWQTLCTKAGVTAPSTLEALIADTAKLTAIFANEGAISYMTSRCTGDFMVAVCNSQTAMSTLVDNIAYDKAFKNEHWYKFMTMCPISLAAMDSVAVTVPTMTSDTTPSGVAFILPGHGRSYRPHLMFDGDLNTFSGVSTYNDGPDSTSTEFPHYFGYEFLSPLKLYKVQINNSAAKPTYSFKNYIIQGSSNGVDYFDIESGFIAGDINIHTHILAIPTLVRQVRIKVIDSYYTLYKWSGIFELQFYGKAVD